MTSYSAVQSAWALEALRDRDFSGIRTFCDGAGGYGHLMCALLQANPGLRGIVLDLPEVVEDTGEVWAAKLGLQERCRYVAGDMWRSCISREAQCDENRELTCRRLIQMSSRQKPRETLAARSE